MDAETKDAIRKLAVAVDGVAGMAAGCAAYIAAMEGAAFADRRKAIGLAQSMVPEGVSGDAAVSPGRVAQAMVEQIGDLARQLQALRTRADRPTKITHTRDWEIRPWDPAPAHLKRGE